MTTLQSEREMFEKFTTPAISGKEGDEETCVNCGEDLSLETYDWFDKGYTLATEDIRPFLTASHRRILTALLEKCAGEKKDILEEAEKGIVAAQAAAGNNLAITRVEQIINQMIDEV